MQYGSCLKNLKILEYEHAATLHYCCSRHRFTLLVNITVMTIMQKLHCKFSNNTYCRPTIISIQWYMKAIILRNKQTRTQNNWDENHLSDFGSIIYNMTFTIIYAIIFLIIMLALFILSESPKVATDPTNHIQY